MNRILVIPDVHGRSFWREPIKEIDNFDKVIFLGDYMDPYGDEATYEEALQSLKDIISLKKENPNKVILLIGNHDCQYMFDEYCAATSARPRFDYEHHKEIEQVYEENEKLFQIAWDCDNEKYGKILFTHAGVTKGFEGICGLEANQINKFFLEEMSGTIPNIVGLASISCYRGGWEKYGSPVWADVREHLNDPVADIFQIFGHTYLKEPIFEENFAMLDTGDTCYILDKNGLSAIRGRTEESV